MIRRRPSQPIIAILTLGISIGAVGLTLAQVYDVALRPLPYRSPERVLVLRETADLLSVQRLSVLRSASTFSRVAAYQDERLALRDADRVTRVGAVGVDSAFMPLLGTQPAAGRLFSPEDFNASASPTVIVSHAFARRWPSIGRAIGASVLLDGQRHVVIGVMPSGFEYPRGTSIWRPISPSAADGHLFYALARIADGAPTARAQSELGLLAARLDIDHPLPWPKPKFVATRFADEARGGVDSGFWLLACAIGLLFLLTASTLANLFLVRAIGRTHEIAVHAALGGSRGELFRQQITESGLISAAGTLLGWAIVWIGATALPRLGVASAWWPSELPIDWRVMGSVALIAIALAAVLALAPLLQFRGLDLNNLLRNGASGVSASRGQRQWRAVLVSGEIALVMFLIVASGVLLKTYVVSERINWGYDTRHTLFGYVMLPQARFRSTAEQTALMNEAQTRLRSIPGIRSATVWGEANPYANADDRRKIPAAQVDGYSGRASSEPIAAARTIDTDSSFFVTMGIRILQGRELSAIDRAGAPPVVVIDKGIADRNWPGQNPIGRHIKLVAMEPNGPWYTVVGVAENAYPVSAFAANVRANDPKSPLTRAMYRSAAQTGARWWPGPDTPEGTGFAIAARTIGSPSALLPAAQRALAMAAPDEPVEELGSMQEYLNSRGAIARNSTTIVGSFAAFGIVLCLIGIVGLVTDSVARRTREIGVRIALGARWYDVIGLVTHETSLLGSAGVVLGLLVSGVLAKLVGHYVFVAGQGIDDPGVLLGAGLGILVVVLGASLLPALRALRVDPVAALRSE